MRNFDYIRELGIDELYRFCSAAEENQVSNPDICAISARRALEYIVRALYQMKNIEIGERTSLFELVDGEPFKQFIGDDKVMMAVHYVRKVGNGAAHTGDTGKKESFFCLLNIYNVVGAILLKLRVVSEVKPFDKNLIPQAVERNLLTPTIVKVQATDALIASSSKEAVTATEPVTEIACDISEAETRKMYIDLMLKEAGWEILSTEGAVEPLKACIEVEVKGMPNAHNTGYADYVLFGSNGKPLAVVEAKRASVSPIKGKHQAELYADCLEQQYGVRPVIYYTNGFETYIIDGLGYPARRLYAFHTANDLEWIIQQRRRKDITDDTIKDEITDRDYQKMAIKAVCEHLNKMHRKGLLVMATGTGKTRVSISLVDVLMRNGWVKNVLFLADRTSLVSQAHKNFVKLLPSTTTCVLNDNNEHDLNARIIFSTYQTMINCIDTDEKTFSVGRFDLIIVDEAHRSIFGKYGAIFNYFDAMLVGLTATPRDEIEKSTYDIFEMEQGVPNFAYELEDAVAEKYLINYRGFKRGSLILKEGIKYSKLSEEEKKQMEDIWDYEQAANNHEAPAADTCTQMAADDAASYGQPQYVRDITSGEIFSYIFNEATIDAVLQDLMKNGLRVQYGERIGKSIVFAYNHHHAEMIVKRFNILYPEYGAEFCALIDNYVTYSQDLIDKFEIRDADPQIAVSVDMLDTGIDVPDILNLVFFKIVKSKIKFLQMIGRGTRLSPNIYSNDKDKDCFYIFDWCRNFEYFEKNPDGNATTATQSLTERIFGLRAEIAYHLQHQNYQEDDYCRMLHDQLKEELQEQVKALSDNHISVRAKWEAVGCFKEKNAWLSLSQIDIQTLKNEIAPLLPKNTTEATAKMFDALIFAIELGFVDKEYNANRKIEKVKSVAERLIETKATLPQVQAKTSVLKEVLSDTAWENATLGWLERVRKELRELMQFLKEGKGKWFVIDIEDVITDDGETTGVIPRVTYKQRVIDFLTENRNLPVLIKIRNLEQLSFEDIDELERILWTELGDKSEYSKFTIGKPYGDNVAAFIRSMIGVDMTEALKKFSNYLSDNNLNSEQEEFLKTIVSYVCANGDITKEIVLNDSPFDERLSIFSPYMIPLGKYIENIHNVIIPQGDNGTFAS